MFTYDQDAFERLIKEYMSKYHRQTKTIETATQVIKDKYGKVLGGVPYLKVTLKDDADILADLAKMPQIRVMK